LNTPLVPICPKCKQTDQIQKVTSTFAANTKEWKSSTRTDAWGNTEITEETKRAHTSLGLKLKLPDEPAGPTHPGLWYGIGGLVVVILGSVLCPIALIPLGFVVPLLVGGSTILPDLGGLPGWAVTLLAVGLPTLCLGILGLVLVIWLGKKIKTRFDRDMKNYREKKAAFERDELPRWHRARDRWEQLFYCMRDETIFIPAENKAIKADDMEKYLYDPQFRSQT
jgi:hypothetical protein